MEYYGYTRISTPKQNLEHQVRNIKEAYGKDITIVKEVYTGTKVEGRKEWDKLYKLVCREASDGKRITIVFDSVSRMSRNAEDGFELYENLYNLGVELVFLKEPHINTETYKRALSYQVQLPENQKKDKKLDVLFEGINNFLMLLAKEQIELAFIQAEKEVMDLRKRTKDGIKTARLNGKQIGRIPGRKYPTTKELHAKEIIRNKSRDFYGYNTDIEVMKLADVSRNTYYKYKKELKEKYKSTTGAKEF